MTQLVEPARGRLDNPLPIVGFPFVDTIDVDDARLGGDEPSPCLPTARSVWFRIHPPHTGKLVIDLGGSTPLDPLVRLYRHNGSTARTLVFLGCASPAWNGNLVLEAEIRAGETYAVQVGTSQSRAGRVVVRVELRERRLAA
jgi:hypothetical protein